MLVRPLLGQVMGAKVAEQTVPDIGCIDEEKEVETATNWYRTVLHLLVERSLWPL